MEGSASHFLGKPLIFHNRFSPVGTAILLRATRFAGFAPSSEALAEEDHLGVAQSAERPLREREAAGAKPATQSILLRAARFAGFYSCKPAKQDALRSLGGGGLPLAPLAQLVERSAYTRRELRTGARLEVRILQGVPTSTSRSSGEKERHAPNVEARCSSHRATSTDR